MWQHTEGVVRTIIWVLLEIYLAFQQWKNIENPLRTDKVTAMSMVYYFFGIQCTSVKQGQNTAKREAKHILSWVRALGPLRGLSTGQLNCCLPRMEEKRREAKQPKNKNLLNRWGIKKWCLRQDYKSIFSLVQPWPLTPWPTKLTVAWRCSEELLCQVTSKSTHLF